MLCLYPLFLLLSLLNDVSLFTFIHLFESLLRNVPSTGNIAKNKTVHALSLRQNSLNDLNSGRENIQTNNTAVHQVVMPSKKGEEERRMGIWHWMVVYNTSKWECKLTLRYSKTLLSYTSINHFLKKTWVKLTTHGQVPKTTHQPNT